MEQLQLLRRSQAAHQPNGPLVFVVLDGVGIGCSDEFDAVANASTETLDRLSTESQVMALVAHGPAVGLAFAGDMGNSEVGHNTLGAGRIFPQGSNVVDRAIRSGRIWEGDWRHLVATVNRPSSVLHLVGLLSDGNVHSSTTHLNAILDRAALDGVKRIRIHILLDGRDVSDFSAITYVEELEAKLTELRDEKGVDAQIASGGGRMTTTMDRYGANWQMVERGWQAHVLGSAFPATSAAGAIETFRQQHPGISDQNLPAFTIVDSTGNPVGPIRDGDAVLVFNFRGDRASEFSEALTSGAEFDHFDRQRVPDIEFVALSLYDAERNFPERYLVHPESVSGTISELIAAAGVDQFACAETQKFGHITYFWNGNRSEKFDAERETYVEIPSDSASPDVKPAMRSIETAEAVVHAINENRYGFIRTNFAAGDMVGHTANFNATRQAIETIDHALGQIAQAVQRVKGCLVITADHGNAEDMVERNKDGTPRLSEDGSITPKTSHSINPVRFLVREFGDRSFRLKNDLPDAGLANVAATLLELLGFEAPTNFEPSLIEWT